MSSKLLFTVRHSHVHLKSHHFHFVGIFLQVVVLFLMFTPHAAAVTRFSDRSLLVYNPPSSNTAEFKLSLTYTSIATVGSLKLEFCDSPIPLFPCVAPDGLDVSNAILDSQTGITGYSISNRSPNLLVLSRTPGMVTNQPSTYDFTNIINTNQPFAIRLSDYSSSDASGPSIDLGAVLSVPPGNIKIVSQVPPQLVFCVAETVSNDCSEVSDSNYSNVGSLSPNRPLTATSQMAVSTNALRGFVIKVYGGTLASGSYVINPLNNPSPSSPGNNQFGMNLRANSSPDVGRNPDGTYINAQPAANYDIPNKFTYNNGDVVASSSGVSLARRFTVSYILNSSPDLHPGIYTGTFTYICSGQF